MAKVSIENDCKKYLQMVVTAEDTRVTISLQHQDGLDLLARLQAYYKDPEMKVTTVREMAIAMIEAISEEKAAKKIVEMLQGQGPGKEG